MKFNYLKIMLLSLFVTGACSPPPERKITLNQLSRSDLAYYIIKDDINSVLDELNKRGEVVVTAESGGKEFRLKIYATSKDGIIVKPFQEQ